MQGVLQGKRILVTRPRHQAGNMLELLSASGADPCLLPLLDIKPRRLSSAQRSHISQQVYHMIIFVSVNAVRHLREQLDSDAFYSLLQPCLLVTTGQKTRDYLQRLGFTQVLSAPSPYNSDALLGCDELSKASVAGQRILLVRGLSANGQAGRMLLPETLRSRKATVETLEVYERVAVAYEDVVIKQQVKPEELDIILLTSGEIVVHFFNLVTSVRHNALRVPNPPLILLGSSRLLAKVPAEFQSLCFCANDPGDESMLAAILANI